MLSTDRIPRVCAVGFWLPCDQASFFHHLDDAELVAHTTLDRSFPENNLLDVSVLRRLVTVLPYKDYTHFFPVFHTSFARTSDPDAAVFIYEHFGEQWESDVKGHGIVQIVTASGFYLWLALYSVPASRKHHKHDEDLVRAKVTDHIVSLVGGDFFSHFSGLDDDQQRASEEDLEQSVKDYRDHHMGMLTFFQLNTILEGMYNSTLDFQVFFYGRQRHEEIKQAKQHYSVGRFIRSITAHPEMRQRTWGSGDDIHDLHLFPIADGSTLSEQDEVRVSDLLFELLALHLEESETRVPRSATARRMAHQLCRSYLTRLTGERLLRRFLHVTTAETLLKLKRRVERCRRALLETMIEVTQRQQPLIQVESPDEPQDRIVGVNPAQLRGYIMLVSAKLPLITNVRYYLKELRIGDQELSEEDPVRVPYRTWLVLLRALISDVRGLERALEQSRMDALVQEEEQMRREEETIAEIERLQERSSQSLEPVTTLAISVVSNALALAAVLLAIVSIVSGIPNGGHVFPSAPSGWGIAAVIGAVLLGLILLIALYAVGQLFFTDVLSLLVRAGKRERRRNDQYYYEMDLHLDRDIDPGVARTLLDHAFKFSAPMRHGDLEDVGLTFVQPERNSYRVERNNEDEALHKVYVDLDMQMAHKRWWQLRRPRLHLVLVFEIMFHRPAQAETYIFQDLRVVSTTGKILSPQQIDAMKRMIVEKFVNPLIPGTPVRLTPEYADDGRMIRPEDSLLSLAGLPQAEAGGAPSTLVTAINALARWWPLPLLFYALGIVANATLFFNTHPPAAALSWDGLAQLSLFDTLVLVLGSQPAFVVAPAVLVAGACAFGWWAVRRASRNASQPAATADMPTKGGGGPVPLRWPHPMQLALGALGFLGTIVMLAGLALRIVGGQ